MHEFEVPQFYETEIVMRHRGEERDRELEFQFLCVPAAAIHEDNRHLLDDPSTLLSELGFAESTPLRVGQLPDAILTLLRVDYLGEDAGSMLELVSNPDWLAGQREEDPEAALFAEYLAFAEVVPFEQSKQRAAPLATTARKSYSPAGQVAGFSGFSGLAPVLIVPHVAVVFLAVVGAAAGSLVVVDSIGVIAGVATGPKTAGARAAVRRGFKRLIRRPDQPEPDIAQQDPSDQPSQSATPETPGKQTPRSHEEVVRLQEELRARAPHLKILPEEGGIRESLGERRRAVMRPDSHRGVAWP
ncbi:MAG: hypothetical protein ACREFO_10000 [Acetobacteraceae bacterium]